MKIKITFIVLLFYLLIPKHSIFAYATYDGAPLGSQLNPINITTGNYSGFTYGGAPLGSSINPVHVNTGGSLGVTYSGAPLGSSINPIYIKNSPSGNFPTGYKLPDGYKCSYSNISEYERDRIAALKNVEKELNKGKTGSSFKGLDYEALYLYKGWLETNFYRYSSNCSNIDSTILSFKSTWSEKVATFLDQICAKSSGLNSYYANETDVNKGGGMAGCGCKTGFKFSNGDHGECISISAISEKLKIDTPICGTGTVLRNNECISYTDDCRFTFGKNLIGEVGPNNNSTCNCNKGYVWNEQKTSCIIASVTQIKKEETICNGKSWGVCLNGLRFYCPPVGDPQCINTTCNSKSWGLCLNGLTFYCPPTGDPQCINTVCNGKTWGVCPNELKFYCPSTGDPQCISDKPVVTSSGGGGGGGTIVQKSVTNKPIVKKSIESKKVEVEQKDTLIYPAMDPIIWKTVVTPAKEEIKNKNIWQRIKGLFGNNSTS